MLTRFRTVLLSVLCALVLGAVALVAAAPVTSAEAEEADPGLGLVYVDRSEVGRGDVQSIAVLADDGAPRLAGATVTLARVDGSGECTLDAVKVVDGAALVELANDVDSLAGDWRVASVTLRWADGTESAVALEAADDLAFTFATEPLEAPETTYSSIDEDGGLVSSDDFDDVAAAATGDEVTALGLAEALAEPSADTLANAIVALDPGHGGEDPGAHGIGFEEKDVNWKISMATRDWLVSHGVRVFVTHEQNETPNPSISARVQRAVDAGACVFISQHNNETPGGVGSEIYIPWGSSYYPNLNEEGQAFADELAPRLERLGLVYRGTKTRVIWDDPDYAYPNGDAGDYYGITRYSRRHGMAGILIEHAFVDTESDAALLRDDAFLQRLGIADAEAIYARLESLYRAYASNQPEPLPNVDGEIDAAATGSVFRLYNQWSGEHLVTTDKAEVKNLVAARWRYEGIVWVDPSDGETVYRLFNPHTNEHLYTTDLNEYEVLGGSGWRQEGAKLHTTDETAEGAVAVYRLFNPYTDQHLFTTDANEYEANQKAGWKGEGVKLYGLSPSEASAPAEPAGTESAGTPIMGESATSREALKSWFASAMAANGKTYPELYAEKGAPTPEDFVQILWEEATDEGVRPDVLLSQVIHETGWLQFGGLVKVEDCNFGGIGATDSPDEREIAVFDDVRTGLRAQSQHLRAYGDATVTKDNLAHACEDPRFDLVNPKGKSPSVEGLSGTWASNNGYGDAIVSFMARSFPNDLA